MTIARLASALSAIVIAILFASPALAADCGAFEKTFLAANGADQSFLPIGNELLLGNQDAIPCLVEIVNALKPRFSGAEIDAEGLVRFIQATGALRTVLANRGIRAIREFRDTDNLDTISALAAGARGTNANARINAALILSDVIDNTSLCVVLDHLYDPTLAETRWGRSGRLNLLGIAAVVAPWAFKENFENLTRLQAYVTKALDNENDTHETRRVLKNLADRLGYQDKAPDANKVTPLPADSRQCYAYTPQWAGKNLVYAN